MPVLTTPKAHFDEDVRRARDVFAHANTLPAGLLRDDLVRSSWMMGVGAVDAYFCDAYADLIARTLQAKQIENAITIPDRLLNLKVPVIAVIRPSATENWRWRMAARELIEDQTVLSLDRVRQLFNQFFRQTHKLFVDSSFDAWVLHRHSRQRLFGVTATAYRGLTGNALHNARRAALEHFEERFKMIFQRRHDCIHNCDRPRHAINSQYVTSPHYVPQVLDDLEFLVCRCQEAFVVEFPVYLTHLGFSAVTRNRVGC
ncbi:MAG TPA: hypothetical protein VKF17_11705 [Isosphaeraceae bacterium]|nr:hypothetical protein [Isosphaeraceae bacterium]